MVEKSDEFDERMLNSQNFPYQNFALKNFTVIIFCQGFSHYIGTVILKYFRHKKDPPESKELYSIRLGHYRRLYPSSLVATELYIIFYC